MAQIAVTNFSNDIFISLGGITLSGFIEGTNAVTLTPPDTQTTEQQGADGSIAVSITNKRMWTITLRLLSTSASNDALAGLQAGQPLGAVFFPFAFIDAAGTDILQSDKCWFKKLPDVDSGNETSTREWVLGVNDPNYFFGGHLN